MGTGGAAGQLWDELRRLYKAAGEPTLDSLVRLGQQQLPPATVSDTMVRPGESGGRYVCELLASLPDSSA